MDISQVVYDRVFSLVNLINNTRGHEYHVFFDYRGLDDHGYIGVFKKKYDNIHGFSAKEIFIVDFATPFKDEAANKCIEYLESIK